MDEKILKYFQGELSANEQAQLIKLIEEDDFLKEDFISMQNLSTIVQLSTQYIDVQEGKQKFHFFFKEIKRKKQRRVLLNTLKYVAVAITLIASTIWTTLYFSSKEKDTKYNTLYVPAGQRAKISLQDGTKVWLNAQSTLKYPSSFSKKSRKVEITGEAFFDVAENTKSPFIVSSQDIEIAVLGTQFNIYSYPNKGYIQTDLVEGSIKAYSKNSKNNAVIIQPNESVIFRDNKITVCELKNSEHLLWKEGVYSFHNEKLIDIIEKLQIYYDVKIIVEDPEIFNFPYTGKFRQRDGIDEILKILQKIQKFDIKKDRENNIIVLTK